MSMKGSVVSFLASSVLACCLADVETGLVALYPLDGNAQDASGHGYHATVYGATPLADGSGYEFNGRSTALAVHDLSMRLKWPQGAEITLAAWVYMRSTNSVQTTIVAMESGRIVQTRSSIRVDDAGRIYYFSRAVVPRPEGILVAPAPLPLNEWHHVAATHSGNTASIYIDGVLVAQSTSFDPIRPPETAWFSVPGWPLPFQDKCVSASIGAWTDWCGVEGSVFNGYIGDVAFYNRALTADDVAELAGVADTTPPEILSTSTDRPVLWPANHKMVDVNVSAVIQDDTDPSPTFTVVAVESSDPGDSLGDGTTEPDFVITGDTTVQLRAERSGRGVGRIYTITIMAVDESGNASFATTQVSVPHDKSKK